MPPPSLLVLVLCYAFEAVFHGRINTCDSLNNLKKSLETEMAHSKVGTMKDSNFG